MNEFATYILFLLLFCLFLFVVVFFTMTGVVFISEDSKKICQKQAFSFNSYNCMGEVGVVVVAPEKFKK